MKFLFMRTDLSKQVKAVRIRLYKKSIIVAAVVVVFFVMATGFSYGATSAPYASGQVNASSGAVLRKSSSTSSAKVTILDDNTKVRITREVFKSKTKTSSTYKWYYVSVNGKTGYIRSDLVDNVKYSAVSGKVTATVNYRVGAGTDMKRIGSLNKGKAVTIYLKASPVSSTKGSSSVWYKIKVDSKYRYVCSSYVDIVGSIFTNNTSTDTDKASSTTKTSTASEFAKMTDSQFDAYLTKQGFPASYKTRLKELHKKHPSWVFVGRKTGISWTTALSKESANGVSLIEGSQPLSYRATDSNSYRTQTRQLYKYASTSTPIASVKSFKEFTVLDEVWKSTTRWCHISLSDGTTGYIKGSLYSYTYPKSMKGTITADALNVRDGAGTSNKKIGSLSKDDRVTVVLKCKDNETRNIWYKIRYNSSTGYVSAAYVRIDQLTEKKTTTTVKLSKNYPTAKLAEKRYYRAYPDLDYPVEGSIAADSEVTVLAKLTDGAGKIWLKVNKDGMIGYIRDLAVTLSAEPEATDVPASVQGITRAKVNYRKTAGTSGEYAGSFNGGEKVTVTGITTPSTTDWYEIDLNGEKFYSCASYIDLVCENAPEDSLSVTETKTQTNKIDQDPGTLTGVGQINAGGTFIPKDGSNWFNADKRVVAYYMDPRNFLNEDRVYMFEDLSYQPDYQTSAVVSKVLSGSRLPENGFTAKLFVDAGSIYGISPVFLAARARQETGGGSIAISGYRYSDKVVYNPFNIGAYSSANPVMNGMNYAYNHGWTTQYKAVKGGASFMASGYINAGQNSIYFQRFNVANGATKVATHQYMTNIQAPYGESYSTKVSYSKFGITNEALTFIIPIYSEMPSSTSLPKA